MTVSTTTPIHTGEQIYLRENMVELIEKQAVNIVGPDPADVGGIAELKRIAEYADLHGIAMAPHGTYDGVFGMAALTHVASAMPQNYIAFEYPQADPQWWYDIVDGLTYPIVKKRPHQGERQAWTGHHLPGERGRQASVGGGQGFLPINRHSLQRVICLCGIPEPTASCMSVVGNDDCSVRETSWQAAKTGD